MIDPELSLYDALHTKKQQGLSRKQIFQNSPLKLKITNYGFAELYIIVISSTVRDL
jgi:hypothetical protein